MVIWAIVAAVLASALTLAAVIWYWTRIAEPRARAALEEIGRQIGEDIEARVRTGVRKGIADAASAETLLSATQKATRTGASLVEDGINVLLGGKPKKR